MNDPVGRFSLGSFSRPGQPRFLGVVRGDEVTPLADLYRNGRAAPVSLLAMLDDWAEALPTLKAAVTQDTDVHRIALSELAVHAPIPDARQVFCTGANYGKHVVEMVVTLGSPPDTDGMDAEARRVFGEGYVARQKAEANPYVFMKPVTTIAGPNDVLDLPHFSEKADWELELGVVIGRRTHRVTLGDAMACVAGDRYGRGRFHRSLQRARGNRTARRKSECTDPGAIGPDWVSAKGAPGFLPTGPFFVPAEFVPNPHDLAMRLSVNGVVMQDDRTSDMTFDIARQIEFIARHALMLPGDILCTGSPAGNGVVRGIFLKEGDVMEAEIEGLGRQTVRCTRGIRR